MFLLILYFSLPNRSGEILHFPFLSAKNLVVTMDRVVPQIALSDSSTLPTLPTLNPKIAFSILLPILLQTCF